MIFNQDQINAETLFMRFLNSPETFFILKGYSGTGKTALTDHFVHNIDKYIEKGNTNYYPLVTATTNKACAVLAERITDFDIPTIYSLMSVSVQENYQSGETTMITYPMKTDIDGAIIFIDEASYLDDEMLETIQMRIRNTDTKVVFIGDPAQLCVGEETPPVFLKPYTSAMLKIIERTGDNDQLREAGLHLRALVEGTSDGTFSIDSPDVIFCNQDEFDKQIKETFMDEETKNESIVLAWRNNTVNRYQNFIRQETGLQDYFEKGDIAVVGNFVKNKPSMYPEQRVRILAVDQGINNNISGYFYRLTNGLTVFSPLNGYKDIKKAIAAARRKNDITEVAKIRETWVDLRLPYVSTIHKAQGSTYKTVFLDIKDVLDCQVLTDRNRMLYVGFTRASHKVYLRAN